MKQSVRVVKVAAGDLEEVLNKVVADCGLDLDIAALVKRAKKVRHKRYKLTYLQIEITNGRAATQSQRKQIVKQISRYLMLGQQTVLRYIIPDQEVVLRRYL